MTLRNDQICSDAAVITPSDTAFIQCNGIYVGTTGTVTVTTAVGTSVLFTAVPAGAVIPLQITQIKATGTTASNIVGFKN